MPRVIITVPDSNSQPYRFQLDREVVNMGRGSDNDIIIDSGSVSGKHSEMHRVKGGYELRDLGSTNGIKLDGNRQQVIPLRSGMTAHLGDVAFEFSLTEDELAVLHKEKPHDDLPPIKEDAPKKKVPVKEKSASSRPVRPKVQPIPQSSGIGFGFVVFFLIVAAIAFYIGLEVRHQKDTDETLIKGIVNKGDAPAEAVPAEK